MITFKNLSNDTPYKIFEKEYNLALKHNQENIEAISISSYDKEKNEIDSRYVNLKMMWLKSLK